jgi:2-dehydropantoate 2-reductase
LKHGPFAYVVVALKNLPDIYSIADIIRPAITPKHTTIVLIQNGIGIERPVLEAFRSNTILSCVPLIGSEQNGRHVLHNDPDIIYVAAFWNDALSCEEQKALCEEFATMYRLGGAEAHVVDDIMHYRWRKLIWNASFNTVCALTGLDSGTIQNTDALRTLIRPAMDDVVAIAKAAGYTYPDDIQDQMVAFTPKEAYLKPSMQVDALKGRPMEVEVILGEALKVAREKNMKVKVLQILYDLLSAVQWTRVNSDS